jgi:hypothetical protein
LALTPPTLLLPPVSKAVRGKSRHHGSIEGDCAVEHDCRRCGEEARWRNLSGLSFVQSNRSVNNTRFSLLTIAATDDFLSLLLGSAAFIGLGVYSYYTGMRNLRRQEKLIMRSPSKYKMGSRQLGIVTISASFVGLGLWRAFN